MSCAFSHLNPVPFHENLAHLAVGASSFANLQPQFPQEHFLHGKSPRLISASWETLERLPRMSPPTSESITTHLLSNTSSSSAAASAAASYLDSVFYKVICTPEFLKSAKENYIQPMLDTEFNQIVLPVECGKNCAFMYLTRLCQGSKGPCILFNACYWLTPNEFQSISGRNSAKDWKRSIRHNGKSIKLLINKGILTVHSPLCDCAYGSGIEPFVEKYSSSSSASPPIIASPSLDTQSPMYGVMDSECSHSDATGGASEDDPDQEEKFSPCTSDGCMTLQHNRKEGHNTRDLQKGVISSSSSSLEGNSERYGDGLFGASESYEELGTSHVPLKKGPMLL
ncbi:unnamed protein product [Orchesella dallaii]|uniref:SAND domain-containing protein n=1 Tax=Orchesella dallaii TaxID=48710 RepID=A0ABP1SAA8_9HEXA